MSDADFFIALERRRTEALVRRDLAAARALHAPDYQLVTPGGAAFSLDEYLGKIEAGRLIYTRWDFEGVAVRSGADLSALRYRATLCFEGGEPFEVWHLDLYERREERWVAAWSQATAIKS